MVPSRAHAPDVRTAARRTALGATLGPGVRHGTMPRDRPRAQRDRKRNNEGWNDVQSEAVPSVDVHLQVGGTVSAARLTESPTTRP